MSEPTLFILFLITLSISTTRVSCYCTVSPPTTAIIVGHDLSLKCTFDSTQWYVTEWFRDDGENGRHQIYLEEAYGHRGVLIRNMSVAQGYSVDQSSPSDMILTLKKANYSHEGYYLCQCARLAHTATTYDAGAYVFILDSEPTFSGTDSISTDENVNLECSLPYQGNALASLQLSNAIDRGLAHFSDNDTLNLSLVKSLAYSVPGNETISNIYFCNIILSISAGTKTVSTLEHGVRLNVTVRFSPRRVSVTPELAGDCVDNGNCFQNTKLRCSAEGSPNPIIEWTIFSNKGVSISAQEYYTASVLGPHKFRCTASNAIDGKMYHASGVFNTNVIERPLTTASIKASGQDSKVAADSKANSKQNGQDFGSLKEVVAMGLSNEGAQDVANTILISIVLVWFLVTN